MRDDRKAEAPIEFVWTQENLQGLAGYVETLWASMSLDEKRRFLENRNEPAPPRIELLDPMTGGPLPSREAELEWLAGFPTTGALCMPVRKKKTN